MHAATQAIASVALGSSLAHAQLAIEISEDGRSFAEVTASSDDGRGFVTRGGATPFPLEPDWQFDLRRQVGTVQVTDMNGDGMNDIVVGCYISNSFPPYDDWKNFIFYNTGTGPEANPTWISDDRISTTDIQVADFNNDTFPDIFSAGGSLSSDSVIYFGTASGPSTTPGWFSDEPTGTFVVGALALDVDKDGDVDLFTGNQGLSPNPFRPMYMFRNQNGVLDTQPTWQSDEASIQGALAAGDYDGDTWQDVAVSKWVNWESGIYRNLGGTLDTVPAWTVGDVLPMAQAEEANRGVGFSDFNDDGNLDLAIGQDPSQMFLGNGSGVFTLDWTVGDDFFGPPQEFRVLDVDDDGDDDVAEVFFSTGISNIYLNNDGTLSTLPDWTYNASEVGTAIAFGDLNNDGRTDMVVGYSGNTCLRVFYAMAPSCPADLSGDGLLNNTDVNLFVSAFLAADPAADFNADGNFNNTDVNLFVAAFLAGCS